MKITLPLPPLGNRYIRRCRTHNYKTDEARDYCAKVAQIGREAGLTPLVGDVAIRVDVYRARKSGDLDGFQKVLLDSLEGVCYENDRQIIDNHSRRFDDRENPRVEVEVWQAPPSQASRDKAARKARSTPARRVRAAKKVAKDWSAA